MSGWRLILDTPRGAAENMAIDEAIMRSCADGSTPPAVRIYSWQRASISIGCLQDITQDRFDLDFCRSEGIDVVRRITGGRAVIHGCDVTFSIALRETDLPDGCSSVLASHRWLMGGVVAGLGLLGMEAQIGNRSGGSPCPPGPTLRSAPTIMPADCFAHVAECDVRVGGKKAVGSAQVRRWGALLEQGSIPYAIPRFDTGRVFGKAGRFDDLPLMGLSYPAIAQVVAGGFRDLLHGYLEPGALSSWEIELAAELARDKYSVI